MLHGTGNLLDRPPLTHNTGSIPQRDSTELTEFKFAISLPADEPAQLLGGCSTATPPKSPRGAGGPHSPLSNALGFEVDII